MSATIHLGDCIEVMRTLPDSSVDSIVTDPPYGLGFMGKAWDSLPPGEEWARECLRVLKPGGHLLAFGGTRTWHRLAVAVEDAGFEVRDSIAWLYGSGFPKSLDVSKTIDKAAGAEREAVGTRRGGLRFGPHNLMNNGGGGLPDITDTLPATDAAREWQGWGTALKPAFEPVVVARKPLTGTVAANVLAHGTGALNIDGCRVGFTSDSDKASARPGGRTTSLNGALAGKAQTWTPSTDAPTTASSTTSTTGSAPSAISSSSPRTEFRAEQGAGRWPANVILDESQAAALDEQSGFSKSPPVGSVAKTKGGNTIGTFAHEGRQPSPNGHGDSGGASRFFYVAKAPTRERPKVDGVAHPTVKPLTLMRWLVRLVTPPGGTVLEPFAGSGTTVEACVLEGFQCIAIEREPDYLPLIQARLARIATTTPEPELASLFDIEETA